MMMFVIIMAIANIDADTDTADMHANIGSGSRKSDGKAGARQKGGNKRRANNSVHWEILEPAQAAQKGATRWGNTPWMKAAGSHKPWTLEPVTRQQGNRPVAAMIISRADRC
jgi:hypothetical protein